jgi:hypothetical protein
MGSKNDDARLQPRIVYGDLITHGDYPGVQFLRSDWSERGDWDIPIVLVDRSILDEQYVLAAARHVGRQHRQSGLMTKAWRRWRRHDLQGQIAEAQRMLVIGAERMLQR